MYNTETNSPAFHLLLPEEEQPRLHLSPVGVLYGCYAAQVAAVLILQGLRSQPLLGALVGLWPTLVTGNFTAAAHRAMGVLAQNGPSLLFLGVLIALSAHASILGRLLWRRQEHQSQGGLVALLLLNASGATVLLFRLVLSQAGW